MSNKSLRARKAPGSNENIFSSFFVLMCVFEAFSSTSMQMVMATIAGYAVWMGGLSSIAGILSGLFYVFSIFTRPISGYCGNRLDKKWILLLSTLVLCLTSVGLTVSSSIAGVMVFRALQGIGYSFQTAVNFALVSEHAPEGRSGETLGYYGLTSVMAQLLAPSFALYLVRVVGYRSMLWVSTGLRLAAVFCVFLLPSSKGETEPMAQGQRFSMADVISRPSLLPACIGFLFAFLNSIVTGFLALYSQSYNIAGAEYFFFICAAASFIGRLFNSKNSDTMTLAQAGIRSGSLLIAAMLLLGLGRSTVTMLLAGAIFGTGYGSLLPITQSRAIKYAPEGHKSTGSNTYFLGIDGGFAIGNMIGGFIAGAWGYGAMYLLYIIPAVVSISIALKFGKEK